jgi:hypothetical protein
MTNINAILKLDNDVEEVKDVVSGGGYIKDTDVYLMKIKHAFFEESKGGALGVNISFKHSDEKKTEANQTIYVTSGKAKGQKPYYTSKQGKKVPLPGFTLVDDMVRLATNDASNLETVTTQAKAVEVYDFAAGGKVNKEVQVIDQLTGAVLKVALVKTKVNKWRDGAPTAEVMERNEIDKVFGQDDRTIREVKAAAPAEIMATWLKRNRGQVRDNTTVKESATTSSVATNEAPVSTDNTDDLFGDD